MTPAPVTQCNACAHCGILGWMPGGDVQAVDYWCEVRGKRAGSETECTDYRQGDPWKEIRRKEREWRNTDASTSR